MKTKKYRSIALFILKFNLLAIPMYLAIFLNISFPFLENLIANSVSEILNILGYSSSVQGSTVSLAQQNEIRIINISTDSTGWKSMYALIALIIASPGSLIKRKLRFLLIGIPSIFLINFIRIVSTILFSLRFGFQYFELLHTVLWREGLILTVVLFWVVFLTKERIIRYKPKLFV